jgi:hypothetical protein
MPRPVRTAVSTIFALAATAVLVVMPVTQASADDGYVSAFSTDNKGWAGAQVDFFNDKIVTFDPVRINDRACGDQLYVQVNFMVRFQGHSAFTRVGGRAVSEPSCDTGPVFERFTHSGSVKVGDAGIQVCYNGYRNCSAIEWRDNPNVTG